MVAQHRTRLGSCDVMRQNPHNAVLSLGHANGTVTLWSPNITTALIKMQCHRVRAHQCAVACRSAGNLLHHSFQTKKVSTICA